MTDSAGDDVPRGSEGARRFKSLRWFELVALMMVTASLLPLVAEQLMVAELASHFRVQIAFLLVLTAVLLTIGKARMFLIAVAFGLLFTLASITPLYLGNAERASTANLRILSTNVNSRNPHFNEIKSVIEANNADVVCIQELSWDVSDYLTENLKGYPFKFVEPRSDNFGIGIYSKHELFDREMILIKRDADDQSDRGDETNSVPSLRAGIKIGANQVTVFNTHPVPPRDESLLKWRNNQMDRLSKMVARIPGNVILCGDLNCTPYSPYFHKWLKAGGLKDSEVGFGVQPSWPTTAAMIGIPLDHVLYKGDLKIVERKTTEKNGSDHDGVFVSFWAQ